MERRREEAKGERNKKEWGRRGGQGRGERRGEDRRGAGEKRIFLGKGKAQRVKDRVVRGEEGGLEKQLARSQGGGERESGRRTRGK